MNRFALFLSAVFLFPLLTVTNGCKEGCDGVVCSPAPPALIVSVTDTATVKDTIQQYDTTAMDTIDVIIDTAKVFPTLEATVVLYSRNGDAIVDALTTLTPNTADSTYILNDLTGISGNEFALIASRGERSDTTLGLTRQTVEGCCGYDVIGQYEMGLQ